MHIVHWLQADTHTQNGNRKTKLSNRRKEIVFFCPMRRKSEDIRQRTRVIACMKWPVVCLGVAWRQPQIFQPQNLHCIQNAAIVLCARTLLFPFTEKIEENKNMRCARWLMYVPTDFLIYSRSMFVCGAFAFFNRYTSALVFDERRHRRHTNTHTFPLPYWLQCRSNTEKVAI